MKGALALFFILALTSFGLAQWAARSERGWEVAFRVLSQVRRVMRFPDAAAHRDSHCTLGDAWFASAPVDDALIRRSIELSNRLERRDGPFALMRAAAGPFWILKRDRHALADVLREQELDIYSGRGVASGPSDIVLDCGANVGVYTRNALDRGASRVIAIELEPRVLECLRRSFAGEIAEGRVVVYPKGVWNTDAELQLSEGDGWASTASSVVLDRGGAGPKVPLTTIDKLVAELGLPRVDFIEMDIEGAEMEALEGAVETIRRYHPRLAISTEHRITDPDRIPALVRRLWPDYRAECGPCDNIDGHIQPLVMFGRPLEDDRAANRPLSQAPIGQFVHPR